MDFARVSAIAFIAGTASLSSLPASAEVLNLECPYTNNEGNTYSHLIWVDFDHNTMWVATHYSNDAPSGFEALRSAPATITPQYYEVNAGGDRYKIDRTTGYLLLDYHDRGEEYVQCHKALWLLPTTQF